MPDIHMLSHRAPRATARRAPAPEPSEIRPMSPSEIDQAVDEIVEAWLERPAADPSLTESANLDPLCAAILRGCGQAQADAITALRETVRGCALARVALFSLDDAWLEEWRQRLPRRSQLRAAVELDHQVQVDGDSRQEAKP